MTTKEINILIDSPQESMEETLHEAIEAKNNGNKSMGDALAAQLATITAINNAFAAIADHRSMKNN